MFVAATFLFAEPCMLETQLNGRKYMRLQIYVIVDLNTTGRGICLGMPQNEQDSPRSMYLN